MLSAFLVQVSGFFDKRFLCNVWFPTFLFGAVGVFVAAVAMGPQTAVDAWSALPALTQVWLSVGGLVLATFVAYICDNLLGPMVRLYEGYWPEWAGWLRRRRIVRYHRRRQHLNDRLDLVATQQRNIETAIKKAEQGPSPSQEPPYDGAGLPGRVQQFQERLNQVPKLKIEKRPGELIKLFQELQALRSEIPGQCQQDLSTGAAWEQKSLQVREAFTERCRQELTSLEGGYNSLYATLYLNFPQDPARLMPTRLGNVIQAAEEYSQLTYNFDAPTVWPRLVPHLPPESKTQLEQSSTPLATMLFCATLSFLFAIIGGILLFSMDDSPLLFLSTVVGGLLLSVWCYTGAVQRAVEYGMLIRTAFDLYRHELLKAIGVSLPSSPLEEWKLWPQLMDWWYFYEPPFDAGEGKSAWYYEGKKPKPGSRPKRDEHVLYVRFGAPPKDKEE